MPTYSPKTKEIVRAWHLIDADGLVLGRLATEVARILRGKHKPIFARHMDTGDHVVIINAERIVMTAGKAADKMSYHHSGYPGGLKETSYQKLLDTDPASVVSRAIAGMVPKSSLGREQLKKLKVYAGPEHPHKAQTPVPLVLHSARRAG